jgi:hypothetical protein
MYLALFFLVTILLFILLRNNEHYQNVNNIVKQLYEQGIAAPPEAMKRDAQRILNKQLLIEDPQAFEKYVEQRRLNLLPPPPKENPDDLFKEASVKVKKDIGIIDMINNDIEITQDYVKVGSEEVNFIQYSNIHYNLPNWINGNLVIRRFNNIEFIPRLNILFKFIKKISGNLVIEDTLLNNLDFFADLSELKGNLTIRNNKKLINICGLKNLDDSVMNDTSSIILYNNMIKFIPRNIMDSNHKTTYRNLDYTFPKTNTCETLNINRMFINNENYKTSEKIELSECSDPALNQIYKNLNFDQENPTEYTYVGIDDENISITINPGKWLKINFYKDVRFMLNLLKFHFEEIGIGGLLLIQEAMVLSIPPVPNITLNPNVFTTQSPIITTPSPI